LILTGEVDNLGIDEPLIDGGFPESLRLFLP